MKNNINHNKHHTIKWITAIALAFALLVGTFSYIGIQSRKDDPSQNVPIVDQNQHTNQVVANNVSAQGIKLMATSTPTTTADDPFQITINATLTASGTDYDNTLTWTATFKDPDSTWASGKSPYDYLTVSVASDKQSVLIDCDDAFGEPIIITATSVDNPACSASCQLDYVKRITNISNFYVNDGIYKNYARFNVSNTVFAEVEYSVGTLTPTVEIDWFSLFFTNGLISTLRNNVSSGMTARSNAIFTVSGVSTTGNSISGNFTLGVDHFYAGTGDTRKLNNALYNASFVATTGVGDSNCKGMPSAVFLVTYNGTEYQTYDYAGDTYVSFERGHLTLDTLVTGVALDPDKFIF